MHYVQACYTRQRTEERRIAKLFGDVRSVTSDRITKWISLTHLTWHCIHWLYLWYRALRLRDRVRVTNVNSKWFTVATQRPASMTSIREDPIAGVFWYILSNSPARHYNIMTSRKPKTEKNNPGHCGCRQLERSITSFFQKYGLSLLACWVGQSPSILESSRVFSSV